MIIYGSMLELASSSVDNTWLVDGRHTDCYLTGFNQLAAGA